MMANWTFLTPHARVLLCVAHDPGVRRRERAQTCTIPIGLRTASDPMTAIADPPAAAITGQGRPGARPGRKIFRTAGAVALVAAIFGFAVPHFASYRSVWASMHAMTWPRYCSSPRPR